MTSATLTQAAAVAARLASMPHETLEDERDQLLTLCSIVRILADACAGESGSFIDLASDIEAQVERERESERLGVAA